MAIVLERLISETAKACGVTVEQILSSDRSERVKSARQLAMFVAHKNFTFCLPEIAAAFGKTHATVIQAVRIVGRRLKIDKCLRDHHKHLQEVLVSVMTSGPSERILELAHFHGDGGPLNVRILGNPNEINLTMCSRGGVMNIAVTANKGGGK